MHAWHSVPAVTRFKIQASRAAARVADKLGCMCLHKKEQLKRRGAMAPKYPAASPSCLPLPPPPSFASRAEDSHAPSGPGVETGLQLADHGPKSNGAPRPSQAMTAVAVRPG